MKIFNRLISNIKEFLYPEEWILAIRERNNSLIFQENGLKESFKILNNNYRFWAADPFLYEKDGKHYLFFEMFDRLKGKGGIGMREYNNGQWSPMHMVIEKTYHLSFPYIYNDNSEICMMPEASYDKCIPIMKAIEFPLKWEIKEQLLVGRKFCDSIIFKNNGHYFLFTQPVEVPYTFAKLELYVKQKDNWQLHHSSPIYKNLKEGARMAGNIIRIEDNLFRSGQNCSIEYGIGLCFFRVDKITSNEYHETLVKKISPEEIKIFPKKKYYGCHTYNVNSCFEVIDLKIKKCNIMNLFFRIYLIINNLFRRKYNYVKNCSLI